jgi:hypothetical protein
VRNTGEASTEIITALQRKTPVIPILLNGAKIPRVAQLPAGLKELSFQNGREIRHAYFPSDVALLVHELKQIPPKRREFPPRPIVEALPELRRNQHQIQTANVQ